MKHATGELGDRTARKRGKDRPEPQARAELRQVTEARQAAAKAASKK
jgi:hypothetical protein